MTLFQRLSPSLFPGVSIALAACCLATTPAYAAGGSDHCASPEPIAGFGSFNFLLTGATDSPELASEPPCGDIARDVWFEWTAPSTDFAMVHFGPPLRFRVYAGSGCPTAGSLINCTSLTPFQVSAGATYIVRLGAAPGGPPTGIGGQFAIINATAAGDSCATPVLLPLAAPTATWGFPANTQNHFTNVEGQNQPACSGTGGDGILEDGWYRWTSPYTGNVRFDCCFSAVATGDWKAAVYLGGSCPIGAPIACDDDSCGPTGSQPVLSFAVVTGQNYLFQVGRSPGFASTAPMTATFRIAPTDLPVNDECAAPSLIQGSGPFAFTLGTTNASTPPACGASVGDVWFRWVAHATGTATFGGCDANFDQTVAVYPGLACPTTFPLFCGDEGCVTMLGGATRFDFPVTCGTPYLLRVSLYSQSNPPSWASFITSTGTFTLDIAAPPCSTFTAFCAGDTPAACPCGNAGLPGRGCSTSFSSQGGLIYGFGSAALSNDTVGLRVEGISASLTTLLQGTSQAGGGAGILFGDGLLCAGGTLTRLVSRIANGGQLEYPLAGDVLLSVLGSVPSATTRAYQAWYRDSALGYCTAGTFNLTNGIEVSWTP